MEEEVRSTAYLRAGGVFGESKMTTTETGTHQPPPAALNAGPKLLERGNLTPQPASQLVPVGILHAGKRKEEKNCEMVLGLGGRTCELTLFQGASLGQASYSLHIREYLQPP